MSHSTIQIDARHLAAAIHSAGRRDIRYYLNAVYIEASETETRTTASDGYTCITLRSVRNVKTLWIGENIALLVPRDTVELVNKLTKGKGYVELRGTDNAWELATPTARVPFVPIDGKFPDYRSIFPDKTSGEIAQYDPELLMRFKKAAKALGVKWNPDIAHNANGSGRVTLNGIDEFCGVIMPVRIAEKARAAPNVSWVAC